MNAVAENTRIHDPATAALVSREAFERGLIIETAGPNDEIIKTLPPLTLPQEDLRKGLAILADSTAAFMHEQTPVKVS